MERNRIQINSDSDILELHSIANSHKDIDVYIEDLDGLRINAKSLLGLLATKDFNGLYLLSSKELPYNEISRFIV